MQLNGSSLNSFDVIVIGAGAAGLMCAITAGQRGRKVLVIDHAEQAGKKILVSGGGRCNFTNLNIDAENYISNNPHFCKSALRRFDQNKFIALVEKYNIPYHEKTLGQLFCDGKSEEIVSLLLKECEIAEVSIKTNCKVGQVQKDRRFKIAANFGLYDSCSLVIATGGLSIPKIGATDFGYLIAKQFGINVNECEPGLVPLTLSRNDLKFLSDLSGLSADALVSCNGISFRGNILFTHKGLSGPAILQISNYWNLGKQIVINLLPDINLYEAIKKWQDEKSKTELRTLISTLLPKRLVQIILHQSNYDKPVNQLNEKEIKNIEALFHQWRIVPSGTEGYEKAEVTKGGIDTNELSSKTFESKKVNGLYFIGEVVDVTGWLGGYNFQWAWASGYCAGLYV